MVTPILKYAFRNAFRFKYRAMVALVILGLGFSFALLGLIYFDYETSYDQFHSNQERIYRIGFETARGGLATSGAPVYKYLLDNTPEVKAAARIGRRMSRNVRVGEEVYFEEAAVYADSTLFDVFSFPLSQQASPRVLTGPDQVVISEKLATKYFASSNALGQQIKVGSGLFQVVGVMEDIPQNSHLQFDMILPIELSRSNNSQWTSNNFYTYCLLGSPTDEENLLNSLLYGVQTHIMSEAHVNRDHEPGTEIDLDRMTAMVVMNSDMKMGYKAQRLSDIHLYSDRQGEFLPNGSYTNLFIIGAIGVLLLIITLINYGNLIIYGLTLRLKEISVRRIFGSSHKSIALLFISESLIVTFIGLFLAILLVFALFPQFNLIVSRNIVLDDYIGWQSILVVLLLWMGIGVLSGLTPGLISRNVTPLKLLNGLLGISNGRKFTQSFMMAVQAAFLLIFLVCGMGIGGQLEYVDQLPKGYNPASTTVIKNAYALSSKRAFKEDLLKQPGVLAASFVSGVPGAGISNSTFALPGAEQEGIGVWFSRADEDYLSTLDISLLEGRYFQPGVYNDSSSIIISDRTAQQLGIKENALGRDLRAVIDASGNAKTFIVIGVINDVQFESLYQQGKPYGIIFGNNGSLIIKHDESFNLESIDKTWKAHGTASPIQKYNFEQNLSRYYNGDQNTYAVVKIISLIAFITTLLGSQTIAAISIQSNLRQLSLRRVLGATYLQMGLVYSKGITRPLLIAALIGLPVGVTLIKSWLEYFAYQHFDYASVLGRALSVLIVIDALIMAYIMFRCKSFNPAKILRETAD